MEETSLASKNINNTAFNFLPVVIKEINVLLQYVLNIVSSYKVDLNRVEDLVRIDEFHKYDRDLITKSIKDNRLLTKKSNNEISFKNIYQYSYEEKIDTYENRFIKYFLNKLKDDLFESYFYKKDKKINFLTSNLTYGDYGTYILLQNYKNFVDLKVNYMEDEILTLYKKLDLLMSKDFFKRIKLINNYEIFPTNVLLNDPNYKYVYSYYVKSIDNFEKSKKVLFKNLNTLLKNKYKNNLNENSTLKKTFSYTVDEFSYTFSLNDVLNITLTNNINNKSKKYILDFKINYFSYSLLLKYGEDKMNIINVDELKEVVDVIDSLSFNIKVEKNICPICKNDLINLNCENCGANIEYYKKNNSLFAWVFNIFDVTFKGDESYSGENGSTLVTMYFTDESVEPLTFVIPKGEQGDAGPAGAPGTGIESITSVDKEDGSGVIVTITYTDDSLEDTVFEFDNGISIVGCTTTYNPDDNSTKITFLLSNGQTIAGPSIKNGEDGVGISSVEQEQLENGDIVITITYDDESMGDNGKTVITLPYKNGEDGRGIKSIVGTQMDNYYYLTITYTDNTTQTLAPITLPRTTQWFSGYGRPTSMDEMNAIEGDYYFDYDNYVIYYFDGEHFVEIINLTENNQPTIQCEVTFNPNGGSFVSSTTGKIIVNKGETIDVSRIPVCFKEGFTFEGYYTTPEGPENLFSGKLDDLTIITKDITFYAYYVEV